MGNSTVKALVTVTPPYSRRVNHAGAVVDGLVHAIAPDVLPGIFDSSNQQHEHDRKSCNLFGKRLNLWNPIQRHHKDEINIGKTMKLLKEILRQECNNCVPRSSDKIGGEPTIRMRFMCYLNALIHHMVWLNFSKLWSHLSRKETANDIPHS